jgi:hypothetical protein
LVIVISGPVELEEGTKAAAAVLGVASGGPIPDPKLRRGAPGSAVVNAEADARGALVTDFGAPDTAAKLAAALAIGAQAGSSFVMYTPTERGGVILVGAAAQKGIVGRLADSATPNALFAAGRSLARAWIERQITGSEANGFFRGELLVLGPGLRPDSMLNNLDNMTPAQFAKAVAAFRNPLCVMVTGK